MSQRAILLAVRDQLRDVLNFTSDYCEVMLSDPPGQPPPWFGEWFVAVHAGNWFGDKEENSEEVFGVNLTVTLRLPSVPADRWGLEVVTKEFEGLDKLLEMIRAAVHFDPQRYKILEIANRYITTKFNGFKEPLKFTDGGRPSIKNGSWVWADSKEPYAAVAQTMTYNGARRVQKIEEQG